MTTLPAAPLPVSVPQEVYPAQRDSYLLVSAMLRSGLASGQRVADLCTGSGVVAIAAAEAGAKSVVAVDVSAEAVRCAKMNAISRGVELRTLTGHWHRVLGQSKFDLVTCNPPYVPDDGKTEPAWDAGPPLAYNAGPGGRQVLDPLCAAAPRLLSRDGSILIVQSEFADIRRSIRLLQLGGMSAKIVAQQDIPFGPVLLPRALWLERRGLLKPGVRTERLVVIRADMS